MFSGTGLELTLPAMRHLRGASKFRQCSQQLQRETSGMLCLTTLTTKTDRTGLMEAECACIHNSLGLCQVEETLESTCFQKRSQLQAKSSEESSASFGNVKSALTIYWLPLYLLKFPVYK
ncbi:hypothetical protein FQA39_LY05235 [Lamprigera yunnana]|nr:hypothetical protein FQA39_LY05235 [Lamprigera yunnana]